MALLWKMICNLGDPMSLRHPVLCCPRIFCLQNNLHELLALLTCVFLSNSFLCTLRSTHVLYSPRTFFLQINTAHELCVLLNSLLPSNVLTSTLCSHRELYFSGTFCLQNNLHELWALLNFLLPEHFADAEEFDALFGSAESAQHVTLRLQVCCCSVLMQCVVAGFVVVCCSELCV